MASIISASTTSATALNLSGDTTGILQLSTGATPTTAVTIDASQNVGIGTSSPADKFVVASGSNLVSITTDGAIEILRNGGGAYIDLKGAAVDYDCRIQSTGNGATASLAFSVNGAVRTTIDYTGKLTNVGTSGGIQASIGTSSDAWTFNTYNSGASYITLGGSTVTQGSIGTSSNIPLTLLTNNTERMRIDASGYALIGYTSSNGAYKLQVNSQIFATSSTIATSDARYKTDVTPISGALDIVNALNPVEFNWKEHPVHAFDTTNKTVGFLAQEVQEIIKDKPYVNSIIKKNNCVIEPEEKDEDGNVIKEAVTEEFLGIAEGNMIAILTKAIQELKAIIDLQATRISALESK